MQLEPVPWTLFFWERGIGKTADGGLFVLRGNRLSRMFNRLVVDLFPNPFRLPLRFHSRHLPILYTHEPQSKLKEATVGPFDAIILISIPTRLGGPGG